MKPWLRIAARLYPRLWKARYGPEFEALLDDAEPAWSDVFDILREAVIMQAKTISGYAKPAAGVVLASVLIAAVALLLAPKHYVASTLIGPSGMTLAADGTEVSDQVVAAWQDALSRQSLSEIIQRPTLNLYPGERRRKPLEDVIEDMQRDLHLSIVRINGVSQFRVSFTYPDPYLAQLVVATLTTRINDLLAIKQPRFKFQVMAPSNLPVLTAQPDRFAFLGWGIGVGLIGAMILAFLHWRAMWTLKVMGCGFAGCIAAAFLSLLIANSYTSRATVRVLLPADRNGERHFFKDAQLTAWLQKTTRDVLDDAALAEIIDRSSLDLYRKEREQWDMQPALAAMRRDLKFDTLPSAVRVSFTYPDRFKAQAVVSAIISKLTDSIYPSGIRRAQFIGRCSIETGDIYIDCMRPLLVSEAASPTVLVHRADREEIQLLDSASLPETPVAPDRRVLAGAGLFLGLFLGACLLRNLPQARALARN
jgi:hypothetical protein